MLRARLHVGIDRVAALVGCGIICVTVAFALTVVSIPRQASWATVMIRDRRRGRAARGVRCAGQSGRAPQRRSAGVPRCGGCGATGMLGRRSLWRSPRLEPAMTGRCPRVVRLVAAVVLATIPFCAAPMASAVSPPPVDDTLLPKPHPPAPPQSTEQREQCFASAPVDVQERAGQAICKVLDLATVWRLTRGAGSVRGRHRHRRVTPPPTSPSHPRRRLRVHRRRHRGLRRPRHHRGGNHRGGRQFG